MRVPVNEPIVSQKAKVLVNDALDTGWISSAGKYVTQFEEDFASYIGTKHATTCTNGTAALHLALLALGVGPGDEVIMPDHTIISCALAALYVGAKPVFVDVEPTTGNINPELIEAKITSKTKAIMVVHLFGHPADMDPIMTLAQKHQLAVVEDAAEAHGAEYKGKKVGSFGNIAAFSFYGNKIVTTGEGGMVLTSDEQLFNKLKLFKDLAHMPGQRFHHEQVGYNYRMTNLQAALGVAHLQEIAIYLEKKKWMAEQYSSLLADIDALTLPKQQSYAKSVYWMYNVVLKKEAPLTRTELMQALSDKGIDTRTYFYPLHKQPVIEQLLTNDSADFPQSIYLSEQGFYLPSGLAITEEQIVAVSEALHEIFS